MKAKEIKKAKESEKQATDSTKQATDSTKKSKIALFWEMKDRPVLEIIDMRAVLR
jgi:hypothetical protein